jgi:hypothetical protein
VFHPNLLDAAVPIKREQTRQLPDISAQHQTSVCSKMRLAAATFSRTRTRCLRPNL